MLHSEICGSKCAYHSPQLIAVNHVLHRLLMPRHSPCALSHFTYRFMSFSVLLNLLRFFRFASGSQNCSIPTKKFFFKISLVALLVVSYLHYFFILFSSCSAFVFTKTGVNQQVFPCSLLTQIRLCVCSTRLVSSVLDVSSPFTALITRAEVFPFRFSFTASGLPFGKWAQVDSNHRPHAYQACALTG